MNNVWLIFYFLVYKWLFINRFFIKEKFGETLENETLSMLLDWNIVILCLNKKIFPILLFLVYRIYYETNFKAFVKFIKVFKYINKTYYSRLANSLIFFSFKYNLKIIMHNNSK